MAEDFVKKGRPKAAIDSQLKQMIAQAASHLFMVKGFGATTTEEIASYCKISKQTLYRLFAGKFALFAAVVELNRPRWLNMQVPDNLPLQTTLEMFFRIDLSDEEEQERICFLEMTLAEGRLYPELSEVLKKCGAEEAHRALADWIQCQADKGRIRLEVDALSTAHMLADMIFGSSLRQTIETVEWRRGEDRRKHISAVIRVFLNGIAC